VIVTAKGEAGAFYAFVKPMTGALRDALTADLSRLKKRLEATPAEEARQP